MAIRVHAQHLIEQAATDEVLFTCPYESFVSSGLWVCATGGATTFGIQIVPSWETAPGLSNNIHGPIEAIAASTTIRIPGGITLEKNDRIIVRAGATTVTFTLFGDGQGEE